jgi:GT2 family glycosyltransferase
MRRGNAPSVADQRNSFRNATVPTNSQLEVSIVIPSYARPEQLRSCLGAIRSLAYPQHRMEVIVVDDGGPGRLEEIIVDFNGTMPTRLVRQSNGGPGSARNLGASIARGDFLVFIDDDCRPSAEWLQALMSQLREDPDCLAGGPVLNDLDGNPYSRASQLISTFVADHYASGRGREWFFTTNNFALSANRFAELRGFDTSIPSATAEDKEFCHRWRQRGYRMRWVTSAVVYHAHVLTLRRFLKQHYEYGKGILFFRLRRRPGDEGHLIPEAFSFYLQLVFHPLRQRGSSSRISSVSLLVLSQIATAAGAVVSSIGEIGRGSGRRVAALENPPRTEG